MFSILKKKIWHSLQIYMYMMVVFLVNYSGCENIVISKKED